MGVIAGNHTRTRLAVRIDIATVQGISSKQDCRGDALTQCGQWHYTGTHTATQDNDMQADTTVSPNLRMGDPEIPPDMPPEVPQPDLPPGIPPAGPPESTPEPPVEIPAGQPVEVPDTQPDAAEAGSP
jgi:hypothetical protein